jgi:hypothetical protein
MVGFSCYTREDLRKEIAMTVVAEPIEFITGFTVSSSIRLVKAIMLS